MKKNKRESGFFGDIESLPSQIELDTLVKPQFGASSTESFQEAVLEEEDFNFDGMFSDDIDASFEEHEEEQEIPDFEEAEAFGLDDLDAEMLVSLLEDGRRSLHSFLYNKTLYKNAKQAKVIARKLSMKEGKTEEEKRLLEALWDFCDQHDTCKASYMESVEYSEKHRDLTVRWVSYQINRMRAMGKRLPMWLIGLYIILVPEIKAGARLFSLADEIPEFKMDFKDMI